MKFLRNAGAERVVDVVREAIATGHTLDLASPQFSLFGFAELLSSKASKSGSRLLLPSISEPLNLLGTAFDRAARNRLQTRFLARLCTEWVRTKAEVRHARGTIPQGAMLLRSEAGDTHLAVFGSVSLTTEGLGVTPGNEMAMVQATESNAEAASLKSWFDAQWNQLGSAPAASTQLLAQLQEIATLRTPESLYAQILQHLFPSPDDQLDEEAIINGATGIRDTLVWQKLFRFQRDGVLGALDKINRFGGCIIADSVGLGKTFEALAIIKYHELRNSRVLVLCPKRLRDNWAVYKGNDRRNSLAADRFNYDILNHTDLSRDGGMSGDIDLSNVNWGNYDLVVIDESHNFRNKVTKKQGESRYDRLMRQVIKEGIRTKVLLLSATPVNNRLADLRNQISFITAGNDSGLVDQGIESIELTTRRAQTQFNLWLGQDEASRTPAGLIEMLGFDYFTLLDLLTIARSRKHIEKYYGLTETGKFPERLPPINVKADVDRAKQLKPIADINDEIRKLHLASYALLKYVLPEKKASYDDKYNMQVRDGTGEFRQTDREESLIHLLRVNLLKRMESSVPSFALTVRRLLSDVEDLLSRIDAHSEAIEELDITDVDLEDPSFEALLVGKNKVKVLLQDLDLIRWRQDLDEDRGRLQELHLATDPIGSTRDGKLQSLRENLEAKFRDPINDGNRKAIVFTAFADTAEYLYKHLAPWVKQEFGLETALVSGSGNDTTIKGLKKDLGTLLTSFSPRSKERPAELANDGEIDLLIATDCISEGQNLQDCDWLVNYDIHWNPVRIIQRFGRIDRIGSRNSRIQLVNFWPNMQLEEYIKLEQRVSGRMMLLDVSATGEENLIAAQQKGQMNDLEYRRKQLLKLQETVIDLEDLSTGLSIADLTLTDFKIDLARLQKTHPMSAWLGASAVVSSGEAELSPGIVFCLRAEGDAAKRGADSGYPLAPHYLVQVNEDGAVALPHTQVKKVLDRLRRACGGRNAADVDAEQRFNKTTKWGEDMGAAQKLLSAAVASIVGKGEERAIASLFSPGGTHAKKGEFLGMNDFEVVAFLVVLP